MHPFSPADILYHHSRKPMLTPCCDHYAGSEKLIRKSIALQNNDGPIFDITLDCEDGAMAGQERQQAELVATYLASQENRFQRIGVRIHDYTHPHWQEDLRIILRSPIAPAYITIPKTQSLEQIQQMIHFIKMTQQECGHLEPIWIDCVIETYGALKDAIKIAALPQIQTLSFGLMDFISEHRGAISEQSMSSPLQFEHPIIRQAKIQIAMACHAHGKIPSHNVTTEIENTQYVAQDAKRAHDEFSFLRMWSIHPNQIKLIVNAFTPAPDIIHDAEHILLAAQKANWGPIRYQNKLHDRASYRYYWYILQRSFATGHSLPKSLQSWFK